MRKWQIGKGSNTGIAAKAELTQNGNFRKTICEICHSCPIYNHDSGLVSLITHHENWIDVIRNALGLPVNIARKELRSRYKTDCED